MSPRPDTTARTLTSPRRVFRRGLTLVELLVSITIMSMIALVLATLSTAVNQSYDTATNLNRMTQHGRSAIRRIEKAINSAHASPQFPGLMVHMHVFSTESLPETLIVWAPDGVPNNPDGLPLVQEIIIFRPNPSNPRELLQMTRESDTSEVPALGDTSAWETLLSEFENDSKSIKLTKYLHTFSPNSSTTLGRVRFNLRLRPNQAQIDTHYGGGANWEDIYWPQNLFTATTGTRQHECLIEIRLRDDAPASQDPMTFWGCSSVLFTVNK
jgi:prepilin-type N-terminal cleavage/methylation domain-containing protein